MNYIENLEKQIELLKKQVEVLQDENITLKRFAYTDELTSVNNRRVLNFVNSNNVFFVAICDLDSFKQINDTYGHLAGDEVLRLVGDILKAKTIKDDIIIRFGGDEFLILSNEPIFDNFYNRIESMRKEISSFKNNINFSCSFAISHHVKENSIDQTILLADNALYESKRKGGNFISVVSDSDFNNIKK